MFTCCPLRTDLCSLIFLGLVRLFNGLVLDNALGLAPGYCRASKLDCVSVALQQLVRERPAIDEVKEERREEFEGEEIQSRSRYPAAELQMTEGKQVFC